MRIGGYFREIPQTGAIDGRGRLRLESGDRRLAADGLYSAGEITGRLLGRGALAACTWDFALTRADK